MPLAQCKLYGITAFTVFQIQVRTGSHQVIKDLLISLKSGKHQSGPVVFIHSVQIDIFFQKKIYNIGVPVPCRSHERCLAIVIGQIRVGAMLKKNFSSFMVAGDRGI